MRLATKAIMALLALAAMPAGDAVADGKNWARDYVRKREAAVFERVTGIDPRTLPGSGPGMIVGGRPSPPGRWPFQVGLLLSDVGNNFDAQFCGGSIIDEEFILTAAHCTDFLAPRKLHILTGTQSLTRGGVRRTVRAIKVHPLWNKRTFDFDVAIVQLERKIPNLGPAEKARPLQPDDEERLASVGTGSFVTGWGDTGSTFPTRLREVAVPIVGRFACNKPSSYDGDVTLRMICAGLTEGGKDSCQGDSGGPLLVKDDNGRFIVQAGITSWGNGCALPNFYGVYSRVARLEPWIQATVDMLGGSPSADAMTCANGGNPSLPSCQRAAQDEAQREVAAYFNVITGKGTDQARTAATAQEEWERSLNKRCRAAAAHKACVAKETRKRADDLAAQLANLH